MKKALILLKTSFTLLIKNISVVYPFLLYLVLIDFVFPGSLILGLTNSSWEWIVWVTLFVLLLAAFSAGWLNMFYHLTGENIFGDRFNADKINAEKTEPAKNKASEKARHTVMDVKTGLMKSVANNTKQTTNTRNPFGLFKHFTTGVGDYFLPLVLGWAIYLGVAAALLWFTHSNILAVGGYPDILNELVNLAAKGPEFQQDLMTRLQNMTVGEQEAIVQLSNQYLLSLAIMAGLTLVSIFWAPIILIRQTNAIDAYIQSVRLFFQNPLPVLILGVLYGSGAFIISALGGINIILGMMAWFAWLYVDMTMVIFLFLWTFEHLQIAPKNGTVDVLA